MPSNGDATLDYTDCNDILMIIIFGLMKIKLNTLWILFSNKNMHHNLNNWVNFSKLYSIIELN